MRGDIRNGRQGDIDEAMGVCRSRRHGGAASALATGPLAGPEQRQRAEDADQGVDDPDEEDDRGYDGFGANALLDLIGDAEDDLGDLVGGLVVGVGEEAIGGVGGAVGDAVCGAAREGVVGEEGEVDVGVVVDPGQGLLHGLDLEPDEAVVDLLDGPAEDGVAEGVVEHAGGLLDEGVERVVDGGGAGVDPAEDVLVQVGVGVGDGAVGVGGPFRRGVLQLVDDFAGELAHLGGEFGDSALHRLEEDILAEAREEAGEGEAQDEERRGGGGVGDDPAHEDLSAAVAEAAGGLDACGGGVGARDDVDDVHGVVGVFVDELRALFHGAPAADLLPAYGHADEHGGDDQHGDEDGARGGGDVGDFIEEGVDAVAAVTEAQLLFGRDGERGAVEGVVAQGAVDEALDFLERGAQDVSDVLVDLVKGGDGVVDFVDGGVDGAGEAQGVELVELVADVEFGDLAQQGAGNAVDVIDEAVEAAFEGVDRLVDVLSDALDGGV